MTHMRPWDLRRWFGSHYQRTTPAAISLGSAVTAALVSPTCMRQCTDLAPLHLSCTVLILQSAHKKMIQLLSRQMQTSSTMCKCKGMIRLFIVGIAYPDAHYPFIVGVNKVIVHSAPQSASQSTSTC